MKRIVMAALVAGAVVAAASPVFAHGHRYHRARVRRTVVVQRVVPRRHVVVVREVVPPPAPRLSATRFVPLPVPRGRSVPPPFLAWHPF